MYKFRRVRARRGGNNDLLRKEDVMAHADKGMGGAEASAVHSAKATKKTKQAGNKGVSKKKRPHS